MKLLTAFFLFAAICTSAFAEPKDYVCFKNDGVYIAVVRFELWDNTSQRLYTEIKEDILLGQKWCSNSFDGSKGDYVNVKVYHRTGFELLDTCKYEKITNRHIVVANGTTYNYWCHDSTDF